MSELPERLKDVVPDPASLVVPAEPRVLGLYVDPHGLVAWEPGAVWTLPAGDGIGQPHSRMTTPAGFAPRWETRVHRVDRQPPGTTLRSAADVLDAWRRGHLLLDPPARAAVDPDDLGDWEPGAGVRVLPLRTATLPPATHTNAYLIDEIGLIVDPGSASGDEIGRLLGAWRQRGQAIFLTHHHADHTSGAVALRERTGLPILAHRLTAERLRFSVDGLVDEGDGLGPWEVLHTPGHAPGHLCLWHAQRRLLVAGDMVASLGTIVIDPPDGVMARYLESLTRLRDLDPKVLFPAHGAPVTDPCARLDAYRMHRLWREQRLLAALGEAPASLAEVTRAAYTDVSGAILWLAERQALAHLEKLRAERRATLDGGLWTRTQAP